MRKILFGAALTLCIVFGLRYCEYTKDEKEQLEESSTLIEKQLSQVGKLIVTEGVYAQVFTYEDSKKFYFDILSATKKALVVVNAKATVAYDLKKVKTNINTQTKTVLITSIPEPELALYPEIEYYDMQQDYLNPFKAEDHNKIRSRIESELKEKIQQSELYTNARNRLISELHKIYILTQSLGWTLEFRGNTIKAPEDFQKLNPQEL